VTWLSWRQFRWSAATAAVGLVAVAILLALTPQGHVLAGCSAPIGCTVGAHKLLGLSHDHLLKYLSTALVGVPALIGAFWGAPLIARELESGSFRLVWTQSVTRGRWFVTKVALVGVSAAVACGLLSMMLGWWSSAAVNSGRISPAMFAERGIVPIGYAVFALAVGLTAGLLIRRTLPAMAVTFVVFVAARMAVQFWLREHLVPAAHAALRIGSGLGISQSRSGISLFPPQQPIKGAWVFSRSIVDSAGHAPTSAFVTKACQIPSGRTTAPGAPLPPGRGIHSTQVPLAVQRSLQECIAKVSARYHEAVTYQPASHYWALQSVETALFVGVALLLMGFSFWWIRERIA
jgi:hypothetical protein